MAAETLVDLIRVLNCVPPEQLHVFFLVVGNVLRRAFYLFIHPSVLHTKHSYRISPSLNCRYFAVETFLWQLKSTVSWNRTRGRFHRELSAKILGHSYPDFKRHEQLCLAERSLRMFHGLTKSQADDCCTFRSLATIQAHVVRVGVINEVCQLTVRNRLTSYGTYDDWGVFPVQCG